MTKGLKRVLLSILTFMVFMTCLLAQEGPSPDTLVYTPDLERILNTPNPASFGADYQPFIDKWQANGFTSSQKRQLALCLMSMEKKGFRPRFDFKDVFAVLTIADEKRGFSEQQFDALINACLKVSEGYNKKLIEQFYQYATFFLGDMALYKDRSYGIYVENADFELKFNGADDYVEDDTPIQAKKGPDAIQLLLMKKEGLITEEDTPPAEDVVNQELPSLPGIPGPVIEFKNLDLVFANRLDTIYLRGTRGGFSFETLEFRGQGGAVDWTNVGLPATTTYAKLKNYAFSVRETDIKLDESYFFYQGKLDQPVVGSVALTLAPTRSDVKSWPKFVSDYADAPMNGLGSSELKYRGGVSYEGARFISRSVFNEPSVIEASLNGELKFKAEAPTFVFSEEDSVVSSSFAKVTIYNKSDSIYHPAAQLVYNYGSHKMSLKPSEGGFETTPFHSSFHNVELTGDRLLWDLNSDTLNLTIGSARSEVPLIVESKNFYNASRYYSLGQLYDFNPLILSIKQAQKSEPKNEFYLYELADDRKINIEILKRAMVDLVSKGLVLYNEFTDYVIVTEKGFHYYNAGRDESDYDDLIIPSIISSAPNAMINLANDTMTVRGVDKFFVSDSLDVIITPTDGIIKISKDRNIEFDGSLEAGNFQFNGQKFKFKYDSFLVKLSHIDSIALEVEVKEGKKEKLNNQMVNTSGVLRINDPNNKSARISKPEFPIFSSEEEASVFFDKSGVLGGAYDSTVFFDVPPFELDSASKADPSNYAFDGTFHSNGIFPEFKESLKVMPDKSFGFDHTIPEEGYNLYGTTGKLHGEIHMDQSGITSPGSIDFLTGNFNPESVTFYLDSMYSNKGIEGQIAAGTLEGTSYPSVKLSRYEINWLAKKDSMKLRNLKDPFQVYDSLGAFDGLMTLSSKGLFGEGEMKIQGSKTNSQLFTMAETNFEARNSTFELSSDNVRKPILSSDDVRVDYNLAANLASIQPEVEGNAALTFPYAQYKTSIPTAEWDISNKIITMTKPDTVDISKSFFYSTRPKFDSLAFNATRATYDIDKQEMKVEGIPYITVADARITPENNEVVIFENSEIAEMKNAVVVFDTAHGYHRFFDASITIDSRTKFRGEATYQLVNAVQDTFNIKFNAFRTEEDEVHGKFTKSSGKVTAEQKVIVSPGFTFKGDISVYAYREALELNGSVKLNLERLEKNVWIQYQSNDDIKEVVIPFDQAITEFGNPLTAGLHFNQGSIYMSFITEKRGLDDDDFFIPKGGNLFYDAEENSYKIENAQKAADPANFYKGNMFSYNEDTQDVSFEGKLDFVSPLSKGLHVEAAGKGSGNLDSATFEVNAMLVMDFGLPLETIPLMGLNLKEMGEKLGVKRAHADRSDLIYKVAEFIGDEATKKWDESYKTVPIPLVNASAKGELLKNLVISNVNLKWSKQFKTFYSEGKIGVSNVGTTDVNMELDGFVEIKKTPEGDIVNVLLQMTDGTWYYFSYDGLGLGVFSSNTAFNTAIAGQGGKEKLGAFKVFPYTLEEVVAWAKNYQKLFYGVDAPYKLLMASDSNQAIKKKEVVEGDGF